MLLFLITPVKKPDIYKTLQFLCDSLDLFSLHIKKTSNRINRMQRDKLTAKPAVRAEELDRSLIRSSEMINTDKHVKLDYFDIRVYFI